MPQCIIECSSELSSVMKFDILVKKLHDIVESFEYFSVGSVKVRLMISEYYLIAGEEENFMHVVIKIFSGRSVEQRHNIANRTTKKLCEMLPSVNIISVEVLEINTVTHSNRCKIEG